MASPPRAVALVPARAGSQRVPGKNVAVLGGHPLIAYSIAAALESGCFDAVVVSTDSPDIAEVAARYGADVPGLRPPAISTATSPDIEWVLHTMAGRAEEAFAILRPTSPFRTAATIRRALARFVELGDRADSLRAVELCRQHPAKMWIVDGDAMQPLLPQPAGETPLHSRQYQSLPAVHVQNSSLEIAWARVLHEPVPTISGSRVAPFLTEGWEGFSIDYTDDLERAARALAGGEAALPPVAGRAEGLGAALSAEPTQAPVVLVHIPRTAGTSLSMLMRHHYRGGAFRGGGNVFARADVIEERLRDIAATSRIRAVAGHLPFGLADRLPADARYLTILREPVARTLSHYAFLTQSGHGEGLVPPGLPARPRDLTIEQCFERGYIPDNLQTRMLCGLVSPYDELPGDGLERAKGNLRERFAYVGTTERFDEFLALLNLELGWPALARRRSRAHVPATAREDLAPDVLALLRSREALDLELHAYADGLLAEALDRAGPGVELELRVIEAATRRWNDDDRVSPEETRALPFEARVALAVKETELARAGVQLRKLEKKLKERERNR